MKRTFKSLAIGDTFDFVSPWRSHNSFFERYIKVSSRAYAKVGAKKGEPLMRVGTINCEVFHVEPKGERQ